jgi:hypothetical protein
MSDPNNADLHEEWAAADEAAKELREGIDRVRERVRQAKRRFGNDNDPDQSPA